MNILKTVLNQNPKDGKVVRFLGSEGRVFRLVYVPATAEPAVATGELLTDMGWVPLVSSSDIDIEGIVGVSPTMLKADKPSVDTSAHASANDHEQVFEAIKSHLVMLYANQG